MASRTWTSTSIMVLLKKRGVSMPERCNNAAHFPNSCRSLRIYSSEPQIHSCSTGNSTLCYLISSVVLLTPVQLAPTQSKSPSKSSKKNQKLLEQCSHRRQQMIQRKPSQKKIKRRLRKETIWTRSPLRQWNKSKLRYQIFRISIYTTIMSICLRSNLELSIIETSFTSKFLNLKSKTLKSPRKRQDELLVRLCQQSTSRKLWLHSDSSCVKSKKFLRKSKISFTI